SRAGGRWWRAGSARGGARASAARARSTATRAGAEREGARAACSYREVAAQRDRAAGRAEERSARDERERDGRLEEGGAHPGEVAERSVERVAHAEEDCEEQPEREERRDRPLRRAFDEEGAAHEAVARAAELEDLDLFAAARDGEADGAADDEDDREQDEDRQRHRRPAARREQGVEAIEEALVGLDVLDDAVALEPLAERRHVPGGGAGAQVDLERGREDVGGEAREVGAVHA